MILFADKHYLVPEVGTHIEKECLFIMEPYGDWDSFGLFFRFYGELISQYVMSLR